MTTPIRILSLGDSYTIGEGVAAAQRWPVKLAGRLRQAGYPAFEPRILARTGWTSGELLAAIAGGGLDGPFDLVTLLIGVNNQYRGYPLAEYEEEFRRLLDWAMSFAGGRPRGVLVLSIPDWGVTPFASKYNPAEIAREIDAFNTANRVLSAAAGVVYVDITGISRRYTSPEWFAEDGLHPSAQMYTAWVEALWPLVVAALV